MNPSIQQQHKLAQGITPVLQQNLKILQATQTELQQLINQAIETNPVLEIDSPLPIIEPSDSLSWSNPSSSPDPTFFLDSLVEEETLSSHLIDQLLHSGIESSLREIVLFLIESLNERGLFELPYDELLTITKASPQEFETALSILRDFDPIGIGAFSLTESLLLQWKNLPHPHPLTEIIILNHLPDLAKKQYESLAKLYNVSLDDIKTSIDEIKTLSFNPASTFSHSAPLLSSPDMFIETDEQNNLSYHLGTRTLPKLLLSNLYKDKLAESGSNKELRTYLKHCFADARLLMNAIEQRQQTLSQIAEYLVHHQADFFLKGKEHLKPLTMNELASAINVHPSTISRAVSGKTLDSPQGIIPLRAFFTSGYTNDENQEVSSQTVQNRIKKLIEQESAQKPLSDEALSKLLKNEGLNIARRTIAKYREQMNILPSHLRKNL